MKKSSVIAGAGIIIIPLLISHGISETFWEKRRNAFERIKSGKGEEVSSPVKKKQSLSQQLSYKTAKEEFGIREVKTFKSTRQFRNPYNITIPVEYGETTEILHNKGKPLIINLQDYHCHYQAQKQIAYISEELIVNAGLKLIMVEGNSKDASLKHLRSMATRERRIEVAEDYLKRGMISGEEYLDIISEYDFKPLGIEDKELYMKNLDAFLEIDAFRKEAIGIVDSFRMVIGNLKAKVYSNNVYEVDKKRKECEGGKITFNEYGKYLLKLAHKKDIAFGFPVNNIKRIIRVAGFEKEIDFDIVNRERDSLINSLSKKLSDEELARLLFKVGEFKNKRINATDFHNYLQQLPHGNWKKEYPEFSKYVEYLNVSSGIDVLGLFNELDRIEDTITDRMFKNDNEKKLWKYARNVEILYAFYALELIPDKYEYFKSNPEEFKIPEWQAILDRMVRKYKLTKTVPQDVSLLVDKMDRVDNFYRLAIERDYVFVKKIKGYMKQENADIGVLITGGFHSAQLSKLIYDAGYSFMTVLPVVTELTDEELYHSVLKYKANLMKQAEQTK